MQTRIAIRGMTCNGCVMSVQNALKKLPGVAAVKVSLEEQQAEINHDPDKVEVEQLKAAIEAIGFEPLSLASSSISFGGRSED